MSGGGKVLELMTHTVHIHKVGGRWLPGTWYNGTWTVGGPSLYLLRKVINFLLFDLRLLPFKIPAVCRCNFLKKIKDQQMSDLV